MKVTPLWASIALVHAPAVFAQATGTSDASTTTTSATPSCTASLIANLCSYPEPGPDFTVASDGRAFCWDYCNDHAPCNFVIFVAGNPLTGTGTCWLYPGETYDASAGSSDCGGQGSPYLYVYDKPTCAGGSSTSPDACAATATPSAVASVCGYPEPGDCFSTCSASLGASECLSQCAKADSCSYVVFNPHNPDNSPFASGSCWMYPNGTYDAGSATTCSGSPEQYVYNNVCPKPSSSSSTSSLLPTSSSSSPPSSSSSSYYSSSPPSSSSTSKSSSSPSSSSSSHSPSASAATSRNGTADSSTNSFTGTGNSGLTSLTFSSILIISMAVWMWQSL